MEKNDKIKGDERKVAPIRVVNLANLQNIKVINKEGPIRQNRRKSIHHVRPSGDEQIEFIETLGIADNSDSSIASSSNSTATLRKSFPSTSKKILPQRKTRTETRPNESLMKRVALLRVCAEYMLNEINIKNVVFGENQSLEMLKAQYMRNSRRKH